jgi:transposase-like protein
MGTSNFSDDFKRDAVAQTTERSYPVSKVLKRLGVVPQGSQPRAFDEPARELPR